MPHPTTAVGIASRPVNNSFVRRAKGRRQHRIRRGAERSRTCGLYLRRQGSAKGSPFHKAGRSRFQGATHSVEEMAGAVWAHWDGGPHRPPREGFDVPRAALTYEYIRNGAIKPIVGSGLIDSDFHVRSLSLGHFWRTAAPFPAFTTHRCNLRPRSCAPE